MSLALALAASCALASAITFEADVSAPISTPLNFPLLDCVGSGHSALALRADYQEHLARVQRDIGFKHIRGHGTFDDDMSLFLDGGANLYNLFRQIDFYLSVNIRPILELSFMPAALAVDPSKTIMHYKGGTSPPKDPSAWARLITQTVQGLVDRYGLAEIRTWRFEVWNEPNGCGFWCPPRGNFQEAYFSFYNTTAHAVRAVDSQLSVGGPATAGLAWVGDFVNFTDAGKSVPASFVSTHSYPTDLRHGSFTRTQFEDQIIAQAEVAEASFLPFVLTETSAGLNNAYDSYFAAAFVAHIGAAFLGVPNIPTISYWTFTDVFEEPGMQSQPYHETFGMQTKWGVPKPSYRSLQLLASLPTTGLPVAVVGGSASPRRARSGPAAAATATSGNVDIITAIDTSAGTTVAVTALVTNYNMNIADTEDPTKGLPIATESGVVVAFSNLPAGAVVPATASVKLLDATHGWAKPTWIAAGSPLYPTPAQIAAELAASEPAVLALPVSRNGSTATVALPPLTPYAVMLVRLEYTTG